MSAIRLIALDLDQTLLNTKKEFTKRNENALTAAAERGIYIVPTTGRFYGGLPEEVLSLPFIRYLITINGARLFDYQKKEEIGESIVIQNEEAIAIMEYLDTRPVIYDCYLGEESLMQRDHLEKADDYFNNEYFLAMVRRQRRPVDDLKGFVKRCGEGVLKIQFFTVDPMIRKEEFRNLPERFKNITPTSASACNLEINHIDANKGAALKRLAAHLGIDMSETMAVGDGLNDVTMIREAGLGIAMGNAEEAVLAIADDVTASNDEDGVALAIEKYCLN